MHRIPTLYLANSRFSPPPVSEKGRDSGKSQSSHIVYKFGIRKAR